MANCKECGNEFQPKNKKGVFCSDKCRQKDYRKGMAKLAKMAREGLKDLKESAKKEIIEVPISEFKNIQVVFPKGVKDEHVQAKKAIENGQVKDIPKKGIVANTLGDEKYKYVPMELPKILRHKLWKQGDPREGTTAFWLKYECYTYDELEKQFK